MPRHIESLQSNGYVLDETRLIVWVGTKKSHLCSAQVIADPEINWLACELSRWLGLPVSRK